MGSVQLGRSLAAGRYVGSVPQDAPCLTTAIIAALHRLGRIGLSPVSGAVAYTEAAARPD